MRRIWASLPGPVVVKAVEAVLLLAVLLVALFFLFEWAGGFLDSGGAITG
ncbi:MAG TPA: hypothetical protein VJ938_11940 [Acidimicrobiia bacterium]|nr:hypothetical protein [Acidimicrobiia bacterium]